MQGLSRNNVFLHVHTMSPKLFGIIIKSNRDKLSMPLCQN